MIEAGKGVIEAAEAGKGVIEADNGGDRVLIGFGNLENLRRPNVADSS